MAEEDTAAHAADETWQPGRRRGRRPGGVRRRRHRRSRSSSTARSSRAAAPITAQPDWATIEIRYRPGPRVVETKSLKLYLETFREVGIFHEHVAKKIRDDLVALLDPESLAVTMRFNRRGGIAVAATSSYTRG